MTASDKAVAKVWHSMSKEQQDVVLCIVERAGFKRRRGPSFGARRIKEVFASMTKSQRTVADYIIGRAVSGGLEVGAYGKQ